MIAAPTTSEPVKVTMSTRKSVVTAVPTSAPPVTMLSTPSGRPISSATSPNNRAENGVKGDGFSTSVLPASSAGTTFDRLSRKGKL